MSQIVELSGWWGSGKSILRGLLDGHPQVFSNPVHDGLVMSFREGGVRVESLKDKDVEQLRKMLCTVGDYFRLERNALRGEVLYDLSSEDRIFMPYTFDFYAFDKKSMQEIMQLEHWTPESILEIIYKNLATALGIDNTPIKYYASMGGSFENQLRNFKTNFPNGKYIYVDRSVEGIIATRSGRRPVKGHEVIAKINGYVKETKDLIESNEVEKILRFRGDVEQLKAKYPNDFLIVSFEELVLNTDKVASEIANFLHITDDAILSKCTHFGVELECNGKKYVGQENDRPEDLLSKVELAEIARRKTRFSQKKSDNRGPSIAKKIFKKISLLSASLSEKL